MEKQDNTPLPNPLTPISYIISVDESSCAAMKIFRQTLASVLFVPVRWEWVWLMGLWPDWEVVHMLKVPQGTWLLKTWSTCFTALASRPASIYRHSSQPANTYATFSTRKLDQKLQKVLQTKNTRLIKPTSVLNMLPNTELALNRVSSNQIYFSPKYFTFLSVIYMVFIY